MKIALLTYSDWLPNLDAFDIVIAVDSGIKQLARAGRSADYWIGDFDSSGSVVSYQNAAKQIIQLPTHKDETDTHYALQFAIEQLAATEVVIFTTHSGRFDHQYVLVLLAQYGFMRGVAVTVESQTSIIQLLNPGTHQIHKQLDYLSLFAWQTPVTGLSVRNVAYPLDNITLMPSNPLGISNEINSEQAEINFENGVLLVIHSRDRESAHVVK